MNLAQVRTLSRAKADEESGDFIGEVELDSYINQGLRFIYGQIVQKFEDYFIVEGTVGNGGLITQVSGTYSYDLPSTLQKLVVVQMRRTSTTSDDAWIRLDRTNVANNGIDIYYPLREDLLHKVGYYIGGNKIFFRPVPTEAATIKLWFVPRVTAMTSVSDVPGIPEEYHELLAEYASIQCLRKSGEGIFAEAYKIFLQELKNFLDTIDIRDQQPSIMMITEDYESDHYQGW